MSKTQAERLGILETEINSLQSDMCSMSKDLHEMNGKMTDLVIASAVSKKFYAAGLALVGVVWPIVYGIIFLTQRT